MIKNYFTIFFFFFTCTFGFSQGSEDFSNASLPTSSYADGTFIGNNNIVWTYVHARSESSYAIDGNGVMLRRADEPSSLSASLTGGIEDFSVDTRKAFTGDSQRNLELVINGNVVAQFQPTYGSGEDATVFPFIVEDINIEGDFTLELRLYGSTGNQQLVLDNLTWTGYTDTTCITPTVTSTTEDEICEGETATISATGDGEDLVWFDSLTGGNELGSGGVYETEALFENTEFYVEARNNGTGQGVTESGGARVSTSATSASNVLSASTPWGLTFDAYEDFTLNSVDVYLASATPGDITMQLKDSNYNLIEELTISAPAGNSSSPVQFTVPLNLDIPAGTGYKLVASSSPVMVREFGGSHPGFPYPIGEAGMVNGGTINNSTSNSGVYYFFYNWSYTPSTSDFCASGREKVTVIVNPIPEAPTGETEQSLVEGSTVDDLDVTGDNLIWYADAEGTTPIEGTTSLEDNTTYYVTQTLNGCESEMLAILVSVTMSVNHVDFTSLTIYPNPAENILNVSNETIIKTAEVFNLLGQKIIEQEVENLSTKIDLSSLSQGTYLVKISTYNASRVLRIVKK